MENTEGSLENAVENWTSFRSIPALAADSTEQTKSEYVEVDDTVTQLDDERHRLFTAVEPKSSGLVYIRVGVVRINILALVLFVETREKRDIENAVFQVDGEMPFQNICSQNGFGPKHERHRIQNIFKYHIENE